MVALTKDGDGDDGGGGNLLSETVPCHERLQKWVYAFRIYG